MGIAKLVLKIANVLINLVVVSALCTAGAYAGYALWDNNRVYAAVDDVREGLLEFKPDADEDKPSFEELLKINPDVKAWLTIDNTGIDYPVVQGKTNLTYINTDVYGNFSLAGSIFLDSRNDGNFNDNYSLLYGHYMEKGRMFGDLELYKDESFFRENQTGTLILPDRVYDLEIYACLSVLASEDAIFDPELWQDDIDELMQFTEDNALYLNRAVFDELSTSNGSPKILALTTCTSDFTDVRTAVLARMVPR
jgi:sortase B